MKAIAQDSCKSSIADFQQVDVIVRTHLGVLYENMLEQKQIISQKIRLSTVQVEKKLSEMNFN